MAAEAKLTPRKSRGTASKKPAHTGGTKTRTVIVSPSPIKRTSPKKSQEGGSVAIASVPAALFVLKILLEKLKASPKGTSTKRSPKSTPGVRAAVKAKKPAK